ncbi:Osmotin, thaumatin-like protein, partial [Basidiobolus meristosporus CBS 931.73]
VNKCSHNVWLASSSTWANSPLPSDGGLIPSGGSYTLAVMRGWQGRFWGRTECNWGAGQTCATGDCGSGMKYCNALSGQTPASLAEFKFDGWSDLDYYDVSLVDGYNLPVTIRPHTSSSSNNPYDCGIPSVKKDINPLCPPELQKHNSKGEVVGCHSACVALGTDEHCCTGAHNSPQTCAPSMYSQLFKDACPGCYSYAYDDATSMFSCSGDYTVQFC